MLSAVVLTPDSSGPKSCPPEAVVRTLAALVPCLTAGVLRDVTLAGHDGLEYLASIADEAGCQLAQVRPGGNALQAGLALVRGGMTLVIPAGWAPEAGFAEEALDLLAHGAGAWLFRAEPQGFLTRLAPGLSRIVAVIAPLPRLVGQAADIAALARSVTPAATLRTRLRRVM